MAINLSRAVRGTSHSRPGQTSANVGPGTYANTHNEPAAPVGEKPVPFNSLQERSLNQNRTTSAITPGPGVYDHASTVTRTGKKDYGADVAGNGSVSFKSGTARIGPSAPGSSVYAPSTILKNPGPGNYPNAGHQDLGKDKAKELVAPLKPALEPKDKTAPSIPPSKISMAQQIATQDTTDVTSIVVRHTGDRGDTVGPGEYDARTAIIRQQPRAAAFHRSKLPRTIFEPTVDINSLLPPRDIPGPGTYEVKCFGDDLVAHAEDGEVLNTYQFSSGSQRPHQVELPPDKIAPGPGQYELTSEIDRQVRSARDRNAQRAGGTAHFGSMTERTSMLLRDLNQPFRDPYHAKNVPGPAHYPSPSSCFGVDPKTKEAEKAVPNLKNPKFHGVHHPSIVMALSEAQGPLQAFMSTDDRPCNRIVEQSTPAPWQYNKDIARGHSLSADLREKAKIGRRGAFGSCADRFFGSPLDGLTNPLDPDGSGGGGGGGAFGSDQGAGNTARSSGGAHGEPKSMFQSTSPRFASAAGPREEQVVKVGKFETPAPGTYDLDKVPDFRSPFRKPRVDHLSFGSAKSRFDASKPGEDVFAEHMPGLLNPGPGQYANLPGAIKRSGAGFSKAKRGSAGVGCTTEAVGPGSYSKVETHMLKRTFNVTTSHAPVPGGSEPSASTVMRSSSVKTPRR